MKKTYVLNTILAVVVGIALAAIILVHTFLPNFVIPKVSIPNLVLLSLIALVLDHYIARGADRCYICIPVFAVITFGLLPFCAGYIPAAEIWKLAIGGGAVFTITTFLFTSVQDRLSSGPACKAAPVISALGLYFAAQCLTGILL
ncbi:MAG: hypothetical protein J6J78_08210 [Clostridia bacterium]|nr:hypothetical protein [Clostridia bacterium]